MGRLAAALATTLTVTGEAAEGPGDTVRTMALIEQIPMPRVAGRLDHATADTKRMRLFVSALGNDSVEVIDLFAAKKIHSITGVSGPKGIVYLNDFDKLYVVSAGDRTIKVFDSAYFRIQTIYFGGSGLD